MTADRRLALVGTRQCIRSVNADVTVTLEALVPERMRVLIVTGDASGVDAHVKRECDRLGFLVLQCRARKLLGKWEGLWAGPERNVVVSRIATDAIVWPSAPLDRRSESAGSWNVVEAFMERGKVVDVRNVAWR